VTILTAPRWRASVPESDSQESVRAESTERVRLAEREALTTVFTIDHDDFETYRIAGKPKLRILPGRWPAPDAGRA
jgi:hypothetical protein